MCLRTGRESGVIRTVCAGKQQQGRRKQAVYSGVLRRPEDTNSCYRVLLGWVVG